MPDKVTTFNLGSGVWTQVELTDREESHKATSYVQNTSVQAD